jgi:hypothetical protein
MVRIRFNLSLIEKIGKRELILEPSKGQMLIDLLICQGISEKEIGMVIADGRWRNISEIVLEKYSSIDVFPHLDGG